MKLFLERLLYFWAGITIIGLFVAAIYWAIKIVIYIAFILPVFICSTISVTTNPCSLGRVNPPQAVSNFLILVGLIT